MIIVRIQGGLGNQLFQYALGRSLAKIHRQPLLLDTSWYANNDARELGLNDFGVPLVAATSKEIGETLFGATRLAAPLGYVARTSRFVRRRSPRYFLEDTRLNRYRFDEELAHKTRNGAYLDGYWQHEKYFSGVVDELRQELGAASASTHTTELEERAAQIVGTPDSVSLHVRRTDFLGLPGVNDICNLEYYERAIALVSERLARPVFFVFSDDMAWVQKHLLAGHEYVFLPQETQRPALDLRLMSLCRAHVLANSTFSWWGAWMDPKPEPIVIGPKVWHHGTPERNHMKETWQAI